MEEQAKVKAESDDESSRPSRRPPRRATGKDEERKRGKRLFGALLGTIGKFQQDSSSARARTSAVKRREAEAKTQERLKQQTEEIDERRKKQDQDINLKRRMEQREFDERAVSIFYFVGWGFFDCSRNQEKTGLANSLEDVYPSRKCTRPGQHSYNSCHSQTGTFFREGVVGGYIIANTSFQFYLPWKLLPAEEERIKLQIEETEDTIAQEQRDFQLRREQEQEDEQLNRANSLDEPDLATDHHHEAIDTTAGDNDHGDAETVNPENDDTNLDNAPVLDEGLDARRLSDLGDTGDVVVEAGEDTVIY